jgi:hypothetical protein
MNGAGDSLASVGDEGAQRASISRRDFVRGAGSIAAIAAAGPAALSQSPASAGAVTPEMFGAKGDGRTNDTAALAAMAAHVNAQGGGEIIFRRATYLVGVQRQAPSIGSGYAFEPGKVMEFADCRKPLIIRGNGARIKCARDLRFGTFDRRSGAPTQRPLPNYKADEVSAPYRWMIRVERCAGPIEISDFELDGSLGELRIGGRWGDTGFQIPTYGLGLYENMGRETVRNVHTHHHALDGLVIDGPDRDRAAVSLIENVRSEYNGRQGCSIVGGRGYRFTNCNFNHTGKGAVASAPGAGVDIEAEAGKKVRNLAFEGCEFSDNIGAGLVADSGDSSGASFTGCTFIGTTSWAAWPRKPYFRFDRCNFIGPIVNAFGDAANAERATKFFGCTFRDDPALSPTGNVYIGENSTGPIADLSDHPNVLFSRCSFLLTHTHVLPWTINVTYSDCTMRQRSAKEAYPRGTYLGRNSIIGKVDLAGSRILGELTVNGVRLSPSR